MFSSKQTMNYSIFTFVSKFHEFYNDISTDENLYFQIFVQSKTFHLKSISSTIYNTWFTFHANGVWLVNIIASISLNWNKDKFDHPTKHNCTYPGTCIHNIAAKPLHNRNIVSVHFNNFACMGISATLRRDFCKLTYIYISMWMSLDQHLQCPSKCLNFKFLLIMLNI